jgi:hypothetical protein
MVLLLLKRGFSNCILNFQTSDGTILATFEGFASQLCLQATRPPLFCPLETMAARLAARVGHSSRNLLNVSGPDALADVTADAVLRGALKEVAWIGIGALSGIAPVFVGAIVKSVFLPSGYTASTLSLWFSFLAVPFGAVASGAIAAVCRLVGTSYRTQLLWAGGFNVVLSGLLFLSTVTEPPIAPPPKPRARRE